MAALPQPRWSFRWIASAMKSAQKSRREKRRGRFKLIAERELRLNDHLLSDINLTTDDVKRALVSPRSWL
ncbi:hypothetical protein O2N63_01670 [Aliiroseovarius sp. KMU-50]|uniref:DUF1127 domain-containing protein n=2 Tax=Aliiroseovarius TaxID=1658781 RepID=A0A2R8AJH4_9RHOB|nr:MULTISPECIES: hypothetical protein [Aliiroseovarius]MDA5092792.1 hypothetical protein [Aliiroseovarius sp. KMU-50]SPF76004.1 hypothetical protein ALP8811_01000 [Aliiroseovarius pelagivivens]